MTGTSPTRRQVTLTEDEADVVLRALTLYQDDLAGLLKKANKLGAKKGEDGIGAMKDEIGNLKTKFL